jgi:hypothetical protein
MMLLKTAIAAFALLLCWNAAHAGVGCTVFYDQVAFDEYCATHGKLVKGIETFEEGGVQSGGKDVCYAPFSVDPSACFPTGLEQGNLIIQDNITPGPAPTVLQPSGLSNALYVIGPGFLGANSNKVGEDVFLSGIHASVDLIFTEPNHTGIGFELSRFDGFPSAGWTIAYFGTDNALLGTAVVPPPAGNEPTKSFFGVWCPEQIGRINVFDMLTEPGPDAIDNVEMWVDLATPSRAASWGQVKSIYR